MRLLLVHGIAQEGRTTAELTAEWTAALNEGLKSAKVRPVSCDVILPFFGDDLIRLAQEYQPRSSDQKDFLIEAAREIAAGEMTIHEDKIYSKKASTVDPDLEPYAIIPGDSNNRGGEAGAVLPEPARDILRLLDNSLPGLTNWSLRRFLNVVYVYINSYEVRRQIDGLVLKAIDVNATEPTLLIGHSLGSVVAYNVLNVCPNVPWRGFLTVGSPLGIKAITDRLTVYKPRIPKLDNCWKAHCESSWLNAYDPRDIVALNPLTPPYWKPKKAIVNISQIDNFTPNRHGIRGYLSDPRLAAAVNAALSN